MGRKKIKIARIEDERSRQVTFLKRRNGVMKKAHELAVLTGSEVGLIIFNGQGKLSEFCSGDMRALIQRYSQYTGPADSRGPKFYESLSREKEDDDDEEQDTPLVSAEPNSSTDASMSISASNISPKSGHDMSAAGPALNSGNARPAQPMDPPVSAHSSQMSNSNTSKRTGGAPGSDLALQTSFLPSDATAGAAEMSPISFNSSRASSIAGHMSGIQIGTPLPQGGEDRSIFNFDQNSAFPTPSPFAMGGHAHHLLSGGSLAARRSSFPTQQLDHSILAGAQILRPQTSAGGVQPSMHAMAPSDAALMPFSFQCVQPSPMTTTAPTLPGYHAPPSAWNASAAFTNHFSGSAPGRPQLFSASSDSRMASTTSTLMMYHESPFISDNDGSQADLVEGINQALSAKRKSMGSTEWTQGAYGTSAGHPLRFSATIPMSGQAHVGHPNLGQVPQSGALNLAPQSGLSRLKDRDERSQSFSGVANHLTLQAGLGAEGMPSTAHNGSAASLPSSDSHLDMGTQAGVSNGVSDTAGLMNMASGATQVSGPQGPPSSGGASLSPVSTGTSAPGATASVPSAPSSIFESPSLANSSKTGDGNSSVSSHGGGVGGSSTSLPELGKPTAAVPPSRDHISLGSFGIREEAMGQDGDGLHPGSGGAFATDSTMNLDFDRLVGSMMSHDAFSSLPSAPGRTNLQSHHSVAADPMSMSNSFFSNPPSQPGPSQYHPVQSDTSGGATTVRNIQQAGSNAISTQGCSFADARSAFGNAGALSTQMSGISATAPTFMEGPASIPHGLLPSYIDQAMASTTSSAGTDMQASGSHASSAGRTS